MSRQCLLARSLIHTPCLSETRPLLRRSSTPSFPAPVKDAQPVAIYFRPSDTSIWPVPSQSFEASGWREHVLPDSSVYFSHALLHVTTDVDLRNPGKFEVVSAFLGGGGRGGDMALPPEGWELWLRDAGTAKQEFVPARAWVHHAMRAISLEQPPMHSNEIHIPEEDSEYMDAFMLTICDRRYAKSSPFRARYGESLLVVHRNAPGSYASASELPCGSDRYLDMVVYR